MFVHNVSGRSRVKLLNSLDCLLVFVASKCTYHFIVECLKKSDIPTQMVFKSVLVIQSIHLAVYILDTCKKVFLHLHDRNALLLIIFRSF